MFRSLLGFNTKQTTVKSPVKNTNASELYQRIQNDDDVILVDVRTPGEYQYDGHIAGSHLIPLQILHQRIHELPQDKPIVVVCRSGNRSYMACDMLARQGFSDVTNLGGGIIGWKRAQLPIE